LSDHAASLLKGEIDKPSASRLLANLETSHVESVEDVNPRTPWLNEPDCLTCHQDFQQPTQIDGFNDWNTHFLELYRIRTGYRGVRCIGCHGSTHAVYPAENPYGENRDNIQPMQYSGEPLPIGSNLSCDVCHTQDMPFAIHHKNMLRPFRNSWLVQ
jgi:hypothetical protein